MARKPYAPRAWQPDMINHALDLPRAGLWAGMGTGKTSATLTAIEALQWSGVETRPALIYAPLRVAQSTWPDEARKWDHLAGVEVVPIVGSPKARLAALARVLGGSVAVASVNYENAGWLRETLGDKWPFGMVVADESTKLKSFRLRQGSARAKAVCRDAHTRATRWLNLTGTPAPNGLLDLWGQTWPVDRGDRLGRTMDAFKQRWFKPSFDGYGCEPLAHAQAEIEQRLADICLTVTVPTDAPLINTIEIELPPKARAIYREMEKKLFAEIDGHEVEAFSAAAKSMKCLQIANGAAYIDDEGAWREVHDEKIQALEDVIEEAAGMPVLVAYHFKSDLTRLRASFPKARVLDANPNTIRDWNAGRIPVLLAHPASAGHGLNLQDGGNILAFFSVNWNLEEHDQIIERIGPMRQKQAGHDRPVFVHYLIARDTIDEVVMERLATKRAVQDLLLEAMKRRP